MNSKDSKDGHIAKKRHTHKQNYKEIFQEIEQGKNDLEKTLWAEISSSFPSPDTEASRRVIQLTTTHFPRGRKEEHIWMKK